MRIAIHARTGSFSERWIDFCKSKEIDYKVVDCYSSDIVCQLDDCDILMWHHSHVSYQDVLFAKSLLFAIQQTGKLVFPDFNTGWHFDDKVGQKYLLESINAPLVPSYVFYTKRSALDWVATTDFPKVFKLRSGAGSSNVRLVKDRNHAVKIVRRAFGQGFSQFDRMGNMKERYSRLKAGKDSFWGICKGVGRLFIPPEFAQMHGREKGYVYFQDFIPANTFDTRVIVIGDKAFAIKRLTRKNDFRASGSGSIIYSTDQINIACLKIAFSVTRTIKSQCLGFDFVLDKNQSPLIVEISYGFAVHGYDPCPGYWDEQLNWHDGPFNPQSWILENLVLSRRNNEQ